MTKRILLPTFFVICLFSLSVSAQLSNFVGTWQNTNSQTRGVTKIAVTRNGNNAFLRAWGQCTPNDCDWGRRTATKYASGPTRNEVNNTIALSASFSSSGIGRFVIVRLTGGSTMEADVFTTYPPGDNRSNSFNKYRFRKSTVATVLGAPVQIAPRNGQRLTNFPRRVRLDWRPVSGAIAYRVEIETYFRNSSGGGSWGGNTQKRVNASQYTHTHVGDQPGRWRVWAIDRNNRAGRKSGWRTFDYRTTPTVLRAPVQVSPANGRVFNRFPRNTLLNWNPVPGATAYRVEIEYFSGGRWIGGYKNVRVTSSQYRFNFVGAQPGRWRVWAISASGTAGRKSPWRTFRYTR
ncbi:MAG: hypothetical protein HKN33_14550 [Pyrinomonadaceae bacterium]|nr:hypothetical protein [Pyrinomonadaceae bacterium]